MAWVFLTEHEELDDEEHVIYTGRFYGHLDESSEITEEFDDLSFDEALVWARERAERIHLDAEDERWNVGPEPYPGLGDLPPAVEARLRSGRRRPLADEWIDRTANDSPTNWEIIIELSPGSLHRDDRPEQEAVVEAVAERLRAAGYTDVSWSGEAVDAAYEEIERQWQAAGKPEVLGVVFGKSDFEIIASAVAPTHRPIASSVRRLLSDEVQRATGQRPYGRGASDITGRWGVEVDVHPPGYDPPSPPV